MDFVRDAKEENQQDEYGLEGQAYVSKGADDDMLFR